jgi:phosphoglucosamine mutase
MEVMMATKKKISQLTADLITYPQTLINIRVKSKKDTCNDPDVLRAVESVSLELGDGGRILLRESGTEPVVRVMVEAPLESQCDGYAHRVVDVIKKKGHCV